MHAMDYLMDLCADHDTLLREKQLLNASLEPTSGLHARTSRSPPWQTALFHPLYCIATSERERELTKAAFLGRFS